jgi:hypothetical protein
MPQKGKHHSSICVIACMAQEKPKNRNRRWSFGKSSHTDHKEVQVDKKTDEDYNVGGATAWPSHKANALHQSTRQYAVTTYISPEDWAAVRIQTSFRGYLVWSFNLLIWLNLLRNC